MREPKDAVHIPDLDEISVFHLSQDLAHYVREGEQIANFDLSQKQEEMPPIVMYRHNLEMGLEHHKALLLAAGYKRQWITLKQMQDQEVRERTLQVEIKR